MFHSFRGFSADMELEIGKQAFVLASSFVLGVLLGGMYDMMRPLRRRASNAGAAFIDALYALCALIVSFSFAMGAANGRFGVWELTFIFLGFTSYIQLLSDRVYPIFNGAVKLMEKFFVIIKNFNKKTAKLAKILFHKVRK